MPFLMMARAALLSDLLSSIMLVLQHYAIIFRKLHAQQKGFLNRVIHRSSVGLRFGAWEPPEAAAAPLNETFSGTSAAGC